MGSLHIISKDSISILDRETDLNDDGSLGESEYRVLTGHVVRYFMVAAGTFDDDTLREGDRLIHALPDFPVVPVWNTLHVHRAEDGALLTDFSLEIIPGIQDAWTSETVEYVELLPLGRSINPNVRLGTWRGQQVCIKHMQWGWENCYFNFENRAYKYIRDYEEDVGVTASIAPKVLAHVTEGDRIIGFVLEKLEGDHANIEDLPACEEAVRRFHDMGLLHGDVNRYNFVINRTTGQVRLVDFAWTEMLDDDNHAKAQQELDSLKDQLIEDTGRGAGWQDMPLEDPAEVGDLHSIVPNVAVPV